MAPVGTGKQIFPVSLLHELLQGTHMASCSPKGEGKAWLLALGCNEGNLPGAAG